MSDQATFYQTVGRRIRQARKDRKMTQEDLGAAVSLTRTSITNIERGRQKLLLHTLASIAETLRIAPASLLPENDATTESELESALENRPEPEREWIRNVLTSARKESDQ